MSRPSALRETLRVPSSHALESVSVPASGDCFYDCIRELLLRHHRRKCGGSIFDSGSVASSSSSSIAVAEGVRAGGEGGGEAVTPPVVPSSQSMRDRVAERLTNEQLDLYKMYAAAGLAEYEFSTSLTTLEQLRRFAKRSGKANGPGGCFWADEFALRTVSEWLDLTLLIVDDQASRGGGGGRGGVGRKRRRREGRDEGTPPPGVDGRFVFIGSHPRGVILHRSRRQHYSAVIVDGRPVMELERLPPSVRSLWPVGGRSEPSEAEPGSLKDDVSHESRMDDKEEKNDDIEEGTKELHSSGKGGSDQKPNTGHDPEEKESASPPPCSKDASSTSPPPQALGKFYCGCAGFSSSSWVGNFYPKSLVGNRSDRQLDHYQQHFRTVEINSTFYGIPTETTVLSWKKQFAKSFRVVAKAPRELTHEQSRLDHSVLSAFLSRMSPLADTLACVLIQCPRGLEVTVPELERIKTLLDEEAGWYGGRVAIEFRNRATHADEGVRRFLKSSGFALAIHPDSLGRSTVGTTAGGRGGPSALLSEYEPERLSVVAAAAGTATSDLVYVRLHGSNDEHQGEYTTEQLEGIALQIHSWRRQGREVFCFFLNDAKPAKCPSSSSPRKAAQPWDGWCAMPKNAKQLELIVYGLSKDEIPDAPKKPKNTLLNFFGKRKLQK